MTWLSVTADRAIQVRAIALTLGLIGAVIFGTWQVINPIIREPFQHWAGIAENRALIEKSTAENRAVMERQFAEITSTLEAIKVRLGPQRVAEYEVTQSSITQPCILHPDRVSYCTAQFVFSRTPFGQQCAAPSVRAAWVTPVGGIPHSVGLRNVRSIKGNLRLSAVNQEFEIPDSIEIGDTISFYMDLEYSGCYGPDDGRIIPEQTLALQTRVSSPGHVD